MFRIKKLDLFILRSFCPLFVGTFLICLFIFMMQFLWRYVDEMVGKGLDLDVLAQFFFYSALTLVPASLPLAVLLASLITFGNFGERFELLAMKASGISLLKIMRPLIVLSCLVCVLSFYFQNVVGPTAQTKLWTLVISMKQKSPELDIPEKEFYDQIDGYNLYVERKDRETGMLHNVMIYNFANGFDNAQIIRADSGRMVMADNKQYLTLHLYGGEQFENLQSQNMRQQNVPYRRETFREKRAIIDFNANFNMIDEGFMTTQSNSKNMDMLQASIDSMRVLADSLSAGIYAVSSAKSFQLRSGWDEPEDTLQLKADMLLGHNVDSIVQSRSLQSRLKLVASALTRANAQLSEWNYRTVNVVQTLTSLRRHQAAWHEKVTLSLACLMFFFIGAPLGGIIRKGGIGMPVVVSVVIFIFYYIINNTGYKLARDGQWPAMAGMWLSTAVLAPLGAYLTYKSNNDSVTLNTGVCIEFLKRFVGMRLHRSYARKEVIIDDPDYASLPARLASLSEACRTYAAEKELKRVPNYVRMWLGSRTDEEAERLNAALERLIEEMSNTRSLVLLNVLSKYPIMATGTHLHPFRSLGQNVACGLFLPLGILFYIRIWMYRVRLGGDLERVVALNAEAAEWIEKNMNN